MVLMGKRKRKKERERDKERVGWTFSEFSSAEFCAEFSAKFRRTQAAVPKEELEMSMIEGLRPAAPSPDLLVDENPKRERDAEQDREKRRRGITCNKKRSKVRGQEG